MKHRACLTRGVNSGDGSTIVAAFAHGRHQRQLAEQRHAEFVGKLLTAAAAENLVVLAVVAGEPAHVLDDAANRQVDFGGHGSRQPRHLLRRGLRSGDHEDLAARQVLAERQRDIASAGRHVDEEEVRLIPEDIGEELFKRLVQHGATPDDCLALGNEVANRNTANTPGFGRNEHLVDRDRITIGAEHARNAVAVDIGVDQTDAIALRGERDSEVGGDGALADTTLARRDQ